MDDGRENRFLLDTSIIVPVAIAGAVAVLIVAFVYCCRQFAFSKQHFNTHHHNITSERNDFTTDSERGTIIHHQQRPGGALSDIFSTAMLGYIPGTRSTRNQYPPPSHRNRANYNSTQVSEQFQ